MLFYTCALNLRRVSAIQILLWKKCFRAWVLVILSPKHEHGYGKPSSVLTHSFCHLKTYYLTFKYIAFQVLLQLDKLHSNNMHHCSTADTRVLQSYGLLYSQQPLCKHILAKGLAKYSVKPFFSAFTIKIHFSSCMKGHLWKRTDCFCSPTI